MDDKAARFQEIAARIEAGEFGREIDALVCDAANYRGDVPPGRDGKPVEACGENILNPGVMVPPALTTDMNAASTFVDWTLLPCFVQLNWINHIPDYHAKIRLFHDARLDAYSEHEAKGSNQAAALIAAHLKACAAHRRSTTQEQTVPPEPTGGDQTVPPSEKPE